MSSEILYSLASLYISYWIYSFVACFFPTAIILVFLQHYVFVIL